MDMCVASSFLAGANGSASVGMMIEYYVQQTDKGVIYMEVANVCAKGDRW